MLYIAWLPLLHGNRTARTSRFHDLNKRPELQTDQKLPTYPSLKLTLTPTSHLGQNDGLGEA